MAVLDGAEAGKQEQRWCVVCQRETTQELEGETQGSRSAGVVMIELWRCSRCHRIIENPRIETVTGGTKNVKTEGRGKPNG